MATKMNENQKMIWAFSELKKACDENMHGKIVINLHGGVVSSVHREQILKPVDVQEKAS